VSGVQRVDSKLRVSDLRLFYVRTYVDEVQRYHAAKETLVKRGRGSCVAVWPQAKVRRVCDSLSRTIYWIPLDATEALVGESEAKVLHDASARDI
jgi:hypothetical protein